MPFRCFWLACLCLLACNSSNQIARFAPVAVPVKHVPYSTEELQRRTFEFFWQETDTVFWQTQDRYPTIQFSSIAATGFGLAGIAVGIQNSYISRQQGAQRALNTLQTLWNMKQGPEKAGVSGYKGFFYHFLTLDKAVRYQEVELSTIDTGLLMAGVLTVMSYFDRDDPTENQVRKIADELYRRVEWNWALDDPNQIAMGWHPENGFINADWNGYNEAMVLLIMAIGSPTHAIPAESWADWCSTYEWKDEHVIFGPLFGHQYSQMFVDFKGIQDPYMKSKGIDYFENSRRATLDNRNYCVRNPFKFTGYSEDCWGLTACDGPKDTVIQWQGKEIKVKGYNARGYAANYNQDDGTIAPTAAGGSYPFTPELSEKAMARMWNNYPGVVGKYGFKDSFNPTYTFGPGNEKGWYDVDYLGIDQGPILIQMENYKTGLIWNTLKKNPYIQAGLKKAGFTGGWLNSIQ
ncbi:MAG: glucoamylase family protein [Saprospiraceae bacterium]